MTSSLWLLLILKVVCTFILKEKKKELFVEMKKKKMMQTISIKAWEYKGLSIDWIKPGLLGETLS